MNNGDSDFTALPGHDASAAIRGFFYQINVTIMRWLELPADRDRRKLLVYTAQEVPVHREV